MAFELPEDIKTEYGVDLTAENKRKILGLNAARLYGIDPGAQRQKTAHDALAQQAEQLYAA